MEYYYRILYFKGYPEDEAASLETLTFRQSNAPNLFLGVEHDDRIVAVS